MLPFKKHPKVLRENLGKEGDDTQLPVQLFEHPGGQGQHYTGRREPALPQQVTTSLVLTTECRFRRRTNFPLGPKRLYSFLRSGPP